MPMEIEAKAHVKNLRDLEKNIISMGAKLEWMGEQRDTYYNHPERDFAKTDEALRVREEDKKIILTYKGPKIDNLTKTREEIKVKVGDMTSIKELLGKLGFKDQKVVKKQRKKYLLGKFKVCLDKVEDLGEFVEIEAVTQPKEASREVDLLRNEVLRILEELGLKELERKSYLELLLAKDK